MVFYNKSALDDIEQINNKLIPNRKNLLARICNPCVNEGARIANPREQKNPRERGSNN